MTGGGVEIVLHIGAHRCASTAIEQALSLNARKLRGEGIVIWQPKRLRRMAGFHRVQVLAERAAGGGRARARLAEAREGFARHVAETGAKTLFISEENILGGMEPNLRARTLYADAAARLAAYAEFLPVAPVRVALGIRSYADYWLSSYLYVLRGRDLPPFAALAPALAAAPRGWREVVADVTGAFPGAEVCLWRAEDLGARALEVAAALVGRGCRGLNAQEGPVNAGLGPGHIPLVAALRAAEPGIAPAEIDARLAGARGTGFRGFGAAEAAALARRYAEDTAEFARGHRGLKMMLTPAVA